MMKIKSEQEFLEDINKLKLENVYILIGDDIERKKNPLKHLKTKIPSEFDYNLFSNIQSIDLLISDLLTPPLFFSKRIIIIDNFEKLKNTDKKAILSYINNQSNSTSLFILHNENLNNYQIKKEYDENINATIVFFQELSKEETEKFFLEFFVKNNITINDDVIKYLSDSIINFSQVKNELEKLWLYSKDKKTLTIQEVQNLIPSLKEIEVSEISKSIIKGDFDKLKYTLNMLIYQKEEPLKILYAIEYALEKILKTKMIMKKYKTIPYELYQILSLNKSDIEEITQGKINLNEKELITALELCIEAESTLKSSTLQNQYTVIMNLVYSILSISRQRLF
ncbi:MAG: DNA polymerase III subunit delta [Elusimicrobiales bacterium]|nr:DNA polymerase III subunit delta [Elusimicrobiales bacterium]